MADDLLRDARELYDDDYAADQEWRDEAEIDLRYMSGGRGQWSDADWQARQSDGRPCLTLNRFPQYVRQIVNDARIRTPNIRVLPSDDKADPDLAKALVGLIRNIEAQSRAEVAYIKALEHAAICGMGHFRIVTEYARDDAWEQDLRIRPVISPFGVVWDAGSRDPVRIDANHCFVLERMTRREFERRFPDAVPESWDAASKLYPRWYDGDFVHVAEYWYKKRVRRLLVLTKDGTSLWADDVEERHPGLLDRMRQDGFIVREREVEARKVCQVLLSGHDVLSDVSEWPGQSIPVIPVLGEEVDIGDSVVRYGLVRHARDPQRLWNLHRSSLAEAIAMAPKAKWLGTTDQIAGLEHFWRDANRSAYPFLPYKPDPQAPGPPQRVTPDLPSQAVLADLALASQDFETTVGIYPASLGEPSNERSGRAVLARQREGDVGTFAYIDNLRRAVEQCGRVLIECIPRIYDTQRAVRVLNEDGTTEFLTLNLHAAGGRLYDVAAGKYDVVADAGLSYSTRREEARESLMVFMQAMPQQASLISDLFAKYQDWPGAEEIERRFRRQLIAQGVVEPKEGEEPPAPPQQDANVLLAQAEMVKAQAAAERVQIEAQTKAVEAQNERIKLLIEVAKLEQQGVKVAVDGIAKDAELRLDRARVMVDAAHKDARVGLDAANASVPPFYAG